MKQFNTTVATLSIAAAGVFAVAGIAKADSTHHHQYSHLPHSHTYSPSHHGSPHHDEHNGNSASIGNAIVLGGLLIGGIALLDALSNSKAEASGYYGYTPPKPVILPAPKPKPKPVLVPAPHQPVVDYTTSCRDHNHIGISWDGPREFSLRRPNGSVLKSINGGRAVMKRVAHALDAFGLDTTCVIKTVRNNGQVEKTRLFLSNGRLARVPNTWGGADRIIKINPDTLQINRVHGSKFSVEKPNGRSIQTFDSRKQARAFIAFLDEKNARKQVIIENRAGENKFAFYAR